MQNEASDDRVVSVPCAGEACNCFHLQGILIGKKRTKIFGEIRCAGESGGSQVIFSCPAIFQCCIANLESPRRQRKLHKFWTSYNRELNSKTIPVEIRSDEKFKAAANRLRKKLSAIVPFPESNETFDDSDEEIETPKWRSKVEAKREGVNRRKEIEVQVNHFVDVAKSLTQLKRLPPCFEILGYKSIPPSIEVLKRDWKKIAVEYHPDTSGSDTTELFIKMRKAYEAAVGYLST